MTVRDDKITILDILKGLVFIALMFAIVQLFPAIFFIIFTVCFWVGETTLFFLPESYRGDFVFAVIGISIIILMPILLAFGKATGETFGVAKGYKALAELKQLFGKKEQGDNGDEKYSTFYYFSRTLTLVFVSLFLIGLFLKSKDLNSESIKDIEYNLRWFFRELIDSIKKA